MTNFIKKSEIKNNWLLIDAENAIVGRLAAYISSALRGKNKNQYTPHMDTGDFVIVTNIEKIRFTGKKITISFLNPILPGLEKEKFIEKLQTDIYKEIDLID